MVRENKEKVLHALCLGGEAYNAQLAELTGLPQTTVQDNINALDNMR
jgi:hypothetical protein